MVMLEYKYEIFLKNKNKYSCILFGDQLSFGGMKVEGEMYICRKKEGF